MDDKDRTDETPGATDALAPLRPGGEPKTGGETDQRNDPATAIPRAPDTRDGDDRASGMIDDPVSPARRSDRVDPAHDGPGRR
jgi:hypothetical protein